jgi:hypothetical protein
MLVAVENDKMRAAIELLPGSTLENTIAALETQILREAQRVTGDNVAAMSRILGCLRTTLISKMRRAGIYHPRVKLWRPDITSNDHAGADVFPPAGRNTHARAGVFEKGGA